MKAELRTMRAADYDEVLALWRACDGLGLTDSDSREGVRAFLRRNPGLSFVALKNGHINGAALCGHDGRRGFIYHLAVAPSARRRGIARALVEACLKKLRQSRIQKCHIVVFARNRAGRRFWERPGWLERTELKLMSKLCS
jgi:ribosomal protein S18 acetylase RimI-like enzyme